MSGPAQKLIEHIGRPVAVLVLALVWCMLLLSACRPSSSSRPVDCDTDRCITGQCNPRTGECMNPQRCGEETLCLDGFSCQEGRCQPVVACEEGRCARGRCVAGACVNLDVCEGVSDCVDGFYCQTSRCVTDRCAGVHCERGVCQRATGQCTNGSTCTLATERHDCLEGYYCHEGTCQSEAAVCHAIGCVWSRGVCNIGARSCVNAENCDDMDRNCLEGYGCGPDNRCIESVCNPLVSSCERGVCDHVDGSCVNARRCMHSAECLSGYQCVGTTCVAEHEGCAVCPGNQRCEYQSASRTFVCLDADHCVDSHDCIRPRTCRGGRCVVQPTCTPDDYEPNNFTPMAAPYPSPDEEPEGVKARLCPSDQDVFRFEPAQHPSGASAGEGSYLVGELTVEPESVGIAPIGLRIRSPRAFHYEVGTDERRVRLRLAIEDPAASHHLEVFHDGMVEPGVAYSLQAEHVRAAVIDRCDAAPELVPGTVEWAVDDSSPEAVFASQCHEHPGSPGGHEAVFRVTVDRQIVGRFEARPVAGDATLGLSLRADCELAGSELECTQAMAEATAAQGAGLERLLEPGTYHLVVHADDITAGARVEVSFEELEAVSHHRAE